MYSITTHTPPDRLKLLYHWRPAKAVLMQDGISVVIPNYNGIGLFPHTLPSVFQALQQNGGPFEVLVSDDCSSDASIEYLSQHFPLVKTIEAETNRGFSVTANRGIAAAKFNHVLLLNSDVKLDPDYFRHLPEYFARPDTFGVMGRIIGWDDDVIQDGAKYPSFQQAKMKTSKNYLLEDEEEMKRGLYTSYLSGANALMDRDKFLRLGGFNEMFSPFYVEDFELSLRAWRLGWKCWYEHRAVCRHRTSTSIRSKSSKHYVRMISNRNKWYAHAIHLGTADRWLWMVQLVPEVLFQLLLLKGYYGKAFLMFLHNQGSIRAARAQLQQLSGNRRLLSVRAVARIIHNSIRGRKVKFF